MKKDEVEYSSPTKFRSTRKNNSNMNLIAGGDFKRFRDRLLSNGFDKESDVDAYLSNFSNFETELVHKRKVNTKNLNYQTCTGDENFFTIQEDSATTDNDFGFENNLLSIINQRN